MYSQTLKKLKFMYLINVWISLSYKRRLFSVLYYCFFMNERIRRVLKKNIEEVSEQKQYLNIFNCLLEIVLKDSVYVYWYKVISSCRVNFLANILDNKSFLRMAITWYRKPYMGWIWCILLILTFFRIFNVK